MATIEDDEDGEERYYFIQYWACTNPKILTFDDLREILYKIWQEVWEKYENYIGENKLFLICKKYKERVLNGAK